MLNRIVFLLLVLLPSAQAGAQTPFVTPAQPQAGSTVNLVYFFGGCSRLVENIDQQTQEVRLGDNRVDVLLSVAVPNCDVPPPPTSGIVPLGSLAQGEYTLNVYQVTADQSFPATSAGLTPTFTTVFGVNGGPAPVPTMRNAGIAVLLVFVLLLAVINLRFQRR